jgi:hypothetical protein
VVAVPNPAFPPAPEGLAVADVELAAITDLTPQAIEPR